jgi:hypothetical protein
MEAQLDSLAKQLGTNTPRRRIFQGLGALGLGSLGVVGLSRGTRAASVHDCKKRCKNHCNPGKTNRECRKDCKRKCTR